MFEAQQLYVVPFFVHDVFINAKFLKVEFLYVHEQFQYHVLVVALVVFTQEQVVLVHYICPPWPPCPPCPPLGLVILRSLSSTQQLYVVPFFVQELFPKFKFLNVELLYVHEQFMYHVFVVAFVVLTQEHVEFVHCGIPPWP